ncbi:MAG: thioredoxin family protein [Arachnia propionica]|uniref:thioredoxin family protein n=1 Tax=Arachnia propionica TaxID=1750 RepID=UPI0027060A01|nr:thioredoxin family protein [Arachnia propionica]
MKKRLVPVAVTALITLAGCSGGSSGDAMSPAMTDGMSPSAMTTPSGAMTGKAMSSSFITHEEYESSRERYTDTTVVLFFNARWCPACRAITEELTTDPGRLPEKTTLVSVDYDEHTELRQRHGVTMQHTFVALDDQGQQVRRWTSTSTEALLKELQG